MRATIIIAATVLALAACSALPGASPGSAPATSPAGEPPAASPTRDAGRTIPPDLTELPSMPLPPELGQVPPEIYAQAAAEAAAVANVGLDQVSVVRAEAVTWNDGSLGCPEPGQLYTQVLTPGYWLVLRAGGQEFDFRASDRGGLKLCPIGQGRPPIEDQ